MDHVSCDMTKEKNALDISRTVVEGPQSSPKPKMYVGSVAVTARGSWLVSFSRADGNENGKYTPERVFLRRSEDHGKTWHDRILVYDGKDKKARQAEMGQLIVVPHTNRIYQFSIRHTGVRFGEMVYTYSDDDGKIWLGPQGFNSAYDVPVPPYALAPNGRGTHLMSKGILMDNGEYILPFSVATDPEDLGSIEAETVFMFCKNLYYEKDPARLAFEFAPPPPHGIRVPRGNNPAATLAQEPHVVQLSDSRLMCTMRTGNGCIYYCISSDYGRTWSQPRPLRYVENGPVIPHPNAPCPFIKLRDGKYILLHHNNDGTAFDGRNVYDYQKNRRPIYIAVGRELPKAAGQPMIFTSSRFLCDSDGIPASYLETTEMSCYAGLIEHQNRVYIIHSNKWACIQVTEIPAALLDNSCLF